MAAVCEVELITNCGLQKLLVCHVRKPFCKDAIAFQALGKCPDFAFIAKLCLQLLVGGGVGRLLMLPGKFDPQTPVFQILPDKVGPVKRELPLTEYAAGILEVSHVKVRSSHVPRVDDIGLLTCHGYAISHWPRTCGVLSSVREFAR
jgi:hypothetical protein